MDKTKILLVDDEVDFLTLMGSIIRGWGYDLIEVSTGKEAVNIVMDKKIDIIILDYKMPEMDGIATLREIRKINKEIPVIMLTGYPNGRSIKSCEELGVSVYTPKLSSTQDVQISLRTSIIMVEKKLGKRVD